MSFIIAAPSGHEPVDQWDALYNEIAPKYGIEPNLCKAHVEYESDGNATAIGSSGRGLGLGQIDAGTYKDAEGKWWYASAHGKTDQILDPSVNLMIMCRDFLAPLKAAFAPNIQARIAGYNAGIDAVQTALADGTPFVQVTYSPDYIRNVLRAYQWFDSQSGQTT
jgi:soluble lytic murein transglycosylase-like protein